MLLECQEEAWQCSCRSPERPFGGQGPLPWLAATCTVWCLSCMCTHRHRYTCDKRVLLLRGCAEDGSALRLAIGWQRPQAAAIAWTRSDIAGAHVPTHWGAITCCSKWQPCVSVAAPWEVDRCVLALEGRHPLLHLMYVRVHTCV